MFCFKPNPLSVSNIEKEGVGLLLTPLTSIN